MKRGLKIYIFRHGQTEFNRDDEFTGWTDSKLTKTGKEDAKIVATRMKDKNFKVAFCTSLSRSKDTLKEVLKFHPECKLILEDNKMIERNYGELNGKTHWQVVQKYGVEKYDLWHRSWDNAPPKGESFKMVEKRVLSFIVDLTKLMKKEGTNVAISAHGNSIRLFRKIMEKMSVEEACEIYVPYDKVYEYTV